MTETKNKVTSFSLDTTKLTHTENTVRSAIRNGYFCETFDVMRKGMVQFAEQGDYFAVAVFAELMSDYAEDEK